MSLASIIRYRCAQCKEKFTYNNNCRCKLCNIKIDASICLSCHNNNHAKGLIASVVLGLSIGAMVLSAKVVQVGLMILG